VVATRSQGAVSRRGSPDRDDKFGDLAADCRLADAKSAASVSRMPWPRCSDRKPAYAWAADA
jgi:hypothetical protein